MKKEILFKLIAFSLPFMLMLIVEVGLRIIGYGESYKLFVNTQVNDHSEYLSMNPGIARKYFSNGFQSDNQTDFFLKKKTDSTFRVFIQGASTVVGFPYYHSASFPRLLKHRLAQTFPDYNIEIVNTGMTAVNSYTLWDLTDEIIEQKPDLVIIYAGHNEYYGALGVGSTSSVGSHPALIRSYLFLKQFRLVQLTINAYNHLLSNKPGQPKGGKTTFMEVMAKNQRISHNSPEFHTGIAQFEGNMSRILAKYQSLNIPVILSTIVSNEKDIKPFMSDSIDEQKFTKALQTTGSKGLSLARTNAMAAYRTGQFYLHQNLDSAKKYLHLAKELDMLRFRAPEAINRTIRSLGERYNAKVLDCDALFSKHSLNQIIGDELLTEHVHPNINGNFMIADALYEQIRKMGFFGDWSKYIPYEAALEDIPVTQIDSLKGEYVVQDLKRSWPYDLNMSGASPMSIAYEIRNPSYEQRKALEIYQHYDKWVEVMFESYKRYETEGNYQQALRTAQSIILEFPFLPDHYQYAGNMSLHLKDTLKAKYYFHQYDKLAK